MKKIHPPTLLRNPSRWGKWLLSASLLLVAILGFFQLYEIQIALSPGKYHETEMILISKECLNIDNSLQKLLVMVYGLKKLSSATGQMCPGSVNSSLSSPPVSKSALEMPPEPAPGWQEALQAVKKRQVSVLTKLQYIDLKLISMQLNIEHQRSSQAGALLNRKPEMEKTLAQIQEFQARSHLYRSELNGLSEKINQLAGCNSRQ